MIEWETISLKELAGYVSEELRKRGIETVLVGGACVTIYSENRLDNVKDRLGAFYHWNDRQGLEQAIKICLEQDVDLSEVVTKIPLLAPSFTTVP